MLCLRQLVAIALVVVSVQADRAWAGGGPENLFLVVNQNSDASLTIANHYIRLREIPPTNVLYLDWQGGASDVSSEQFRGQILSPILETIESRKLVAQIDYVVYSADFPYRVKFGEEFKEEKLSKQFRPTASLTGATYLWIYSMGKNPALVMPTVNWYVHPDARRNQVVCQDCSRAPTRGFRAQQFWTKNGTPTSDRKEGQTYFLSTMLGVTLERGNTVDEVIRYLTRSSVADASQPPGTFYFMKNSDVRSKARHDCFRGVADQLQAEGAQVAILDGTVPETADSALGIMTGTASVSIGDSVSIAPGAICEHFTSSGGSFNDIFQSKLTEWLRAGAAGSSGTVAEPYAIQAKFPLPSMHLHYRRGASLAEAFYQSVSGPYQLLVVGDALCQPWAKPPEVEIEGLEPGAQVSGQVVVKANVTPQPGTTVGMCELYIDGRLIARYPHMLPVPLDTSKLAPGAHELRVVAATADKLEFRGRAVVPITVLAESPGEPEPGAPDSAPVSIEVSPQPMVSSGTNLTVTVAGPEDAHRIDILQNHRRVGYVEGPSGSVSIDTRLLGRGPVSLVAQVATSKADELPRPEQATRSSPFWILVR